MSFPWLKAQAWSIASIRPGTSSFASPAPRGRRELPPPFSRAHLDMVNEKNSDVDHDFSKDPIRPVMDGEYLTADGTTLGSDNGIGVAAMLAILEATDLAHGPLEFLFTIDEETGLTGAGGLDPSMLAGRRLLNLDSEEEGAVTVGCAGGADTEIRLASGHDSRTRQDCTSLQAETPRPERWPLGDRHPPPAGECRPAPGPNDPRHLPRHAGVPGRIPGREHAQRHSPGGLGHRGDP